MTVHVKAGIAKGVSKDGQKPGFFLTEKKINLTDFSKTDKIHLKIKIFPFGNAALVFHRFDFFPHAVL